MDFNVCSGFHDATTHQKYKMQLESGFWQLVSETWIATD